MSNFDMYQNSGYNNNRNRKRTLILDIDDSDNTHLGSGTEFKIDLREPLIIDKHSEIYLDNFLTFNCNLGDTHNHSAFVLKINEFNINSGVASSTSSAGNIIQGGIVIPNDNNNIDNYFGTVVHKGKKFNYICDINPTTLHSINGQISDLSGNSIFHGSGNNDNKYVYAITGITGWTGTTGILIKDTAIISIGIISVGTFNGPIILANVEVNGQTILFSSATEIAAQALPTASKAVTVTTSVGAFTLSSATDSLQLLKDNGRFIAEFTIVSKE